MSQSSIPIYSPVGFADSSFSSKISDRLRARQACKSADTQTSNPNTYIDETTHSGTTLNTAIPGEPAIIDFAYTHSGSNGNVTGLDKSMATLGISERHDVAISMDYERLNRENATWWQTLRCFLPS